MSQEFLSQDEVDALLKGVNGEADGASQPKEAGGVRPYNLATQERIVRDRMPALDVINDRFARRLKSGLFDFMRRSPEISVGPVRVIRYDEFVASLVAPTNLNVVQLGPLRGNALFVFEPTLIFLVVDNLFGGDGRFHARVEGREFTTTEQRIIRGAAAGRVRRLPGIVGERVSAALRVRSLGDALAVRGDRSPERGGDRVVVHDRARQRRRRVPHLRAIRGAGADPGLDLRHRG